jgi:ankyrin repeat protein
MFVNPFRNKGPNTSFQNPFKKPNVPSVVVPNPASGILRTSNKNNKKEKELQRLTNELINAVILSKTDAVLDLIAKGADVNKAAENGVTPLLYASNNGQVGIVDLLLEHGADVNADTGSGEGPPVNRKYFESMLVTDGITPLMAASGNGHIAVVNSLLKAGADVNKANKQGGTPLYYASQNGHIAIVDSLLKAKADVNKALDSGATPLIIASNDGSTAVVDLLLKAGADVNKANNSGTTSLMFASRNGHANVVRLLLKAGADASIKSKGYSVYNTAKPHIKNILTGQNNPSVVVPNPAMGISTESHNGGGRRKSRKPRKSKRKTRRNY